uniref:Uncharacterized protein n=1 Tax=Mycena chlorophos TaxID=658473 RepID=A0ABQ0M0P4_MYCCL|nr:predicted protein [Mycena chlorophos]
MLSFTKLTALSTLAFAALTSAAPVNVQQRQLSTVSDILSGLLSDISPVTDLLNSITASNATSAVLEPILTQLGDVINPAVSALGDLAGQPASTILATADGVLDAAGVASLMSPILSNTYSALDTVLAVANDAGVTFAIQPLLNEAGALLNPLLAATAPLVNGLLAALGPEIAPLLTTIDDLGLGSVLELVESIL